MCDIKYILAHPGLRVVNTPDCFTTDRSDPDSCDTECREVLSITEIWTGSDIMRVKYSQTPPPVVEEAEDGARVTKQLTQVRGTFL